MYSRMHNSVGVRNERTKFTLSDKPNWLFSAIGFHGRVVAESCERQRTSSGVTCNGTAALKVWALVPHYATRAIVPA